jgi:hypothetical protein
MKTIKCSVLVILLIIIALLFWNFSIEKHYVSDRDFVMRKDMSSPDGKHRIIEYEYDLGALGYGAGATAITPSDYQNLNLADYKIPNCYEVFGWTETNDLTLSVDSSASGKCSFSEKLIRTGDILQEVKVQIVNSDEFLLQQGVKRDKSELLK